LKHRSEAVIAIERTRFSLITLHLKVLIKERLTHLESEWRTRKLRQYETSSREESTEPDVSTKRFFNVLRQIANNELPSVQSEISRKAPEPVLLNGFLEKVSIVMKPTKNAPLRKRTKIVDSGINVANGKKGPPRPILPASSAEANSVSGSNGPIEPIIHSPPTEIPAPANVSETL
jgi:hypothetical protein